MKVLKATIHYVTIDDTNYIRFSPNDWELITGSGNVSVKDSTDLERQFKEFMNVSKNRRSAN